MSKFYSAEHRKLQDEFGTRRLADLMEGGVMHTEFAPHEIEFIQSRDMFFLSTVDPAGRPTVSYQGGAQGFVE
ncbi:MAG: pyridoxamine 5'-phosphate oxidase family protein [Methylocystis sp.]